MQRTKLAARAVVGLIFLCSGWMARAEKPDETCSNRTLRGDYGFTIEGVTVPAALPIRGVALTHFDGRGNLTQVDHVVFSGFPPAQDWTPGKGSYQLNDDCTGTMRIDIPTSGDFVNLRIVVVKNGRQIRTVVTGPFAGPPRNVTSTGIKVQ